MSKRISVAIQKYDEIKGGIMINLLILIFVIFVIIMGFITWCCLKVGAQADKEMENELERPDLIQINSRK